MALENKAFITSFACITLSLLLLSQQCSPEENLVSDQTSKKHQKKNLTKKTEQSAYALPATIDAQQRLDQHEAKRTIEKIFIKGNKVVSQDAILHTIPVKVGDVFNVNYTSSMIKNLYKLGYFHQINIYSQPIDDHKINLLVEVEEKPKLNNVTFSGNKAFSEKELKEHLDVEKLITLSQPELKPLITKLKVHYHKKNYHNVEIKADLTTEKNNTTAAHFTIKEGKKTHLNRISFQGNKQIPSKKLKRIIYSQEDWLFSFLNRAGVYNSEMVEADKYMIEDVYHNHGFINAKVTNAELVQDKQTRQHHITYTIHEGDRYRVKEVIVEGNSIIPTERLRSVIPIYEGQPYSSEGLRTAMENLRMLWGEFGYIFADIDPNISTDDEHKTVSITFNTDIKNQIYLNRLTIKGNKKTRDKVIRRQILLEEGTMITNQKMEVSKACVGLLGYFDPKTPVSWKTTRIDDTHADLDLIVNEIKTGSFSTNISFGGSPTKNQSPQTGLSANISFGDKNFLGSGNALALSSDISKRYRSFDGSVSNPWLFDRPIRGTLNGYIRSSEYDEQINIAQDAPLERAIGGAVGVGYVPKLLGGIMLDGRLHFENISYSQKVVAAQSMSKSDRFIAQVLLDKNFQPGNQISLITTLGQDKRNGVAFPTNGYQWNYLLQWSFPGWKPNPKSMTKKNCNAPDQISCSEFNYVKSELDASWYTPLIGETDLILSIHGNIGWIHPFAGKDIPWKNLYHIGGPQSIRGYTYGQVGPTWKDDSLGARKAFYLNIELIIPLTANLNTRAVIFYDGGAGWDTPYYCDFVQAARKAGLSFDKDFANNNFFYRHSVGIGVRMKSPSPFKVDFGIKLNPSKKFRKHLTEMHFSMDQAF